jgi:hypothetical protein
MQLDQKHRIFTFNGIGRRKPRASESTQGLERPALHMVKLQWGLGDGKGKKGSKRRRNNGYC